MAQAVNRWLLTVEARVRARVFPCGICGVQNGTGTDFSPSSSVFACQYYLYITWGTVAAVQRHRLTPTTWTTWHCFIIISSSLVTVLFPGTSLPENNGQPPPRRLQVFSLCVMFLHRQISLHRVLNAVLVLLSDIVFVPFSYNFSGPNAYQDDKAFLIPHSLNFNTYICYFTFFSPSLIKWYCYVY
jgi:hypothetical protein